MKEIWNRIDTWLVKSAPELYEDLQSPATSENIEHVENLLGINFPEDVRESFKIHNGQKHPRGILGKDFGLIDGWGLFSLEKIVEDWQMLNRLRNGGDFRNSKSRAGGATVTDWWHPKWIPITYDRTGDCHCIDLNPSEKGVLGQIIIFWHDYDKRPVEASSYREWLGKFADELEMGEYELTERCSLLKKE